MGEASAIAWLAEQGALIFTPLFRSPNYDLIAEMEGRVVRIEVKTSFSILLFRVHHRRRRIDARILRRNSQNEFCFRHVLH